MKTPSLKLPLLALLWGLTGTVNAADNDSRSRRPTGPSRDEFKDVVVYNIFDPERGPKPPPPPRKTTERKPPAPRTDRLTLTGIIMGENGNYGFFDGSDRDFQRVVKQGDKLAKFDVLKVTTEYVDLSEGTNKFQLKIRSELSRTGEEAWKTGSSSSGSYARTGSTTGSTSGSSPSAAADSSSSSGSGGADDERKKRLLELLKKRRAGK
jgi:hypothetical protein